MLSASVSGMNAAAARISAAAGNIANATTPNYSARRVDLATDAAGGVQVAGAALVGPVDLATELAGLITARAAFQVNVGALKAANETLGSVLDLIA